MRIHQKRLRGVADLRTISGLGAKKLAPHAAYMKITSLELEKLRLSRVRQNAQTRIAEIDARCEDIQAEKAALLAATVAPRAAEAAQSQPIQSARGFPRGRPSKLSLRY
jgi:hypothetical protein